MNQLQAKKFLPLIIALSEGKQIQFFEIESNKWLDIDNVSFNIRNEYRIKPESKWYRVAKMQGYLLIAETEDHEDCLATDSRFIKWITPRIEYEE